jgi:hypothetical protein
VVQFEELAAGFGYSLGLGALPVKRIQTRGERRDSHGRGRNPRTHEVPEDIPVTPRMYQKLAARIEGKSSRARCGLMVHFTAPTVHPGWAGPLTLEMINLGPKAIILRPGMHIAQLIIEEVRGEIFLNPSAFQNQSTPEGGPSPVGEEP